MSSAVLRVVEREAIVFSRLWRASLFSSFVQPTLYLAAMGLGLGGLIDRRGPVAGLDYLTFVTPGMLAASSMQLAAGESMWPVLVGAKWRRNFHAAVATPVSPGDVFCGLVIWISVRAAIAGAAFLVVATVLGGVASPLGLFAVPAAVLGAVAFAAPLAAFAATQETDIVFPLIMRLGILPLFLFSGTFFPITALPGWLRPVSYASPLWHAVELAREATTGHLHLAAAGSHVAVLAGCTGVGLIAGIRTFTARLAP